MRRVVVLGLLLVLLLSALTAPAAASPMDDMRSLAAYFPADTAMFFSVRTDDAFIGELDALIAHVADKLPPGTLPPFTLGDALDQGVADMAGPGATFANTIRPWLGNAAAIGLIGGDALMGLMMGGGMGMQIEPPVLVAVQLADREAAAAFVEQAFRDSDVDFRRTELRRQGGWTLFEERRSDGIIAINDGILLAAAQREIIPLNSDFRSLANNADVQAALELLPSGQDYNALLALNLRETLQGMMGMMQMQMQSMSPETSQMLDAFMPIYDNYPAQAIGFTILGGRSLAMDFAQTPIDLSVLQDTIFGSITPAMSLTPVDTAFAAHVPADAPLVLQGTGFGKMVDAMITGAGLGVEFGMQAAAASGSDEIPPFLQDISAGDVRAFADLAVAGMTGLNLSDEILPALDGSFAIFARVLPSEFLGVTLDAAFVFENDQAASTQPIYDAILNALTRYEANFTQEGDAIVLPRLLRGLLEMELPARALSEDVFDFLIGQNDDVFAFGTRAAVEYSLAPDGPSLADDPAYQDASEHFLPGAQSVGYIGVAPVRGLLQRYGRMLGGGSRMQAQVGMAQAALGLVDSASFSAVSNEDYSAVMRFVITLAE